VEKLMPRLKDCCVENQWLVSNRQMTTAMKNLTTPTTMTTDDDVGADECCFPCYLVVSAVRSVAVAVAVAVAGDGDGGGSVGW
jgi:hypothetical protein